MIRTIGSFAAVLLLGAPLFAGSWDSEYSSKGAGKSPTVVAPAPDLGRQRGLQGPERA